MGFHFSLRMCWAGCWGKPSEKPRLKEKTDRPVHSLSHLTSRSPFFIWIEAKSPSKFETTIIPICCCCLATIAGMIVFVTMRSFLSSISVSYAIFFITTFPNQRNYCWQLVSYCCYWLPSVAVMVLTHESHSQLLAITTSNIVITSFSYQISANDCRQYHSH